MINILYSSSKNIFKGILLSALSIIKHCKEPIHIFMMSNDVTYMKHSYSSITEEQNNLLDSILKSANPESLSTLIDVDKYYVEYFKDGKNRNSEYSPYATYRLFADLIPEIPGKLIYLDTDTMATGDISELYNIDIEGYELGMALDYMGKFWISPNYTNSGVLLMNLDMIRETGMFAKCRDLVKNKWMKMPDQSAINKSISSKMYIDGRFNEQRKIKPNTVIKHFCKGIRYFPFFKIYNVKQWDIERVHKFFKIHDFDDIYEKYNALIEKYPYILG